MQRQNAKKTYAKNTEKLKEQKLAYKKEHLETVQAKQRERYQRIKGEQKLERLIKRVLSNDFTPEQRQAIVTALIHTTIGRKIKLKFISKRVNTLDIDKKEHLCKILLAYDIDLRQNNNGVWCYFSDINDRLI